MISTNTVTPSKSHVDSPLYTTHDPIYIDGNSNFISANGVNNPSAAGTEANPYLIEGWNISASFTNGIEIRNTNVYFIIRNCYVHDCNYFEFDFNNGIYFHNVTNGRVETTNSSKNLCGIFLYSSNNCTISNNRASNNIHGILLSHSNNNILSNNTFENNGIVINGNTVEHFNTHNIDTNNIANEKPIYYYKNQNDINIDGWSTGQVILANCTNFTVNNVDCSNASIGVQLGFCNNCSIESSTFNNGIEGIYLHSSSGNNILSSNSASNNDYGIWLEHSSNNTISNNSALSNRDDGIKLRSSNNNNISNNNASNNGDGIVLHLSSDNIVSNNDASNNGNCGIYLHYSSNNNISNNSASNNGIGIHLQSSSNNNNISNNNASNNHLGFHLLSSSNNIISNNSVYSNSGNGIYLYSSRNNTIYNNSVSNNFHGIFLISSSYSTLVNNTLEVNGILIHGISVEDFNTHNIDTTNTANGKPIYYYKNQNNVTIEGWGVGQVILANCTNFTVNNVDCSNADVGVELVYCDNCSIESSIFNNEIYGILLYFSNSNNLYNNSALNNYCGIELSSSGNNTIYNNSASNNWVGISLCGDSSSNNKVVSNNFSFNNRSVEIYHLRCKDNIFHHNNFINGTVVNVIDNGTNTEWDDGYGEGNYWSNYFGLDDGSNGRIEGDGVGDTNIPHMGLDDYPLMEPVEQPYTPDTTPPLISSVIVAETTNTSATITWVTDESSDSRINYAVNVDLSFGSTEYNFTTTTNHSITLTGLSPETTYYFEVSSTDTYGNTATNTNNSNYYKFTTLEDTMPPTISSVTVSEITSNSVTITWTTDENSDSRVNYSINADLSSNLTKYDSTMTTTHSITLTNLNPETTYYFEVISTDNYGNTATDNNNSHYYTFTTEKPTTAGLGFIISDYWWVILLVIIIVTIIVIVVISKRKKGKFEN